MDAVLLAALAGLAAALVAFLTRRAFGTIDRYLFDGRRRYERSRRRRRRIRKLRSAVPLFGRRAG